MIVTGGARAGWMNVSWPLARLSASPGDLTITGPFVGTRRFRPSDVVAIEPYGLVPLIGRGVRIVHTRADCPSTIIFFRFGSADRLLARISEAGFVPCAPSAASSGWSGMPVKWSVVIAVIASWNALFLADGFVIWRDPKPPGPFVTLALVLLLLGVTGIKASPAAQHAVLKPGRSVEEIAGFLSLLQLISALMLVIGGVSALLERRAG